MNREERAKQLRHILTHRLKREGVPPLDETMRLLEDLHLDSIMLLQLIVYIEEDLKLMVPANEVNPTVFDTVGSLLDFMERLHPAPSREASPW
ncbi:MAG: petrobactin biosynthesis protein AsbD [Brevibacillus sp.]|nr:petrobactin biosynthesis protein AsbD [Brevibacillus sp.]